VFVCMHGYMSRYACLDVVAMLMTIVVSFMVLLLSLP